ncbi:MAG: HD domain-containing phosphohydrolase [Cyanobacteriota bacterium]
MPINQFQIAEIILNTSLFGNLSEENRVEIAKKMKEIIFESKDIIVKAGEQGDSLYLIVGGLVEVLGSDYLTGEEFVLAYLGSGDCFGEMSLLTGERRSASVRAFEKTSVLQLDSDSFNELMLSSSHMGLSISKILAERLAKLNSKIEELKGQQTAINKMFNTELDISSEIAIVGRSNSIKNLQIKIEEVSKLDGLWAIKGNDGTGKRPIARLIHRYGYRINEPFLVLDCSKLDYEQQKIKLMGSSKEPGYLKLALSGTILLSRSTNLHKELFKELMEISKTPISKLKYKQKPLILCSFDYNDPFVEEFFEEERIINIPSLASRKQDIPLIAKKILERLDKTNNTRPIKLSSKALTRLLEHNWPGNLTELESVLEQSLVLSKAPVITEDKIIFDLPAAMQDPYLESVKSLAIALDAKDPYTAGHSERVARYSRQIAKLLGFQEDFIENLATMALFHDVGKIGVPESILRKQTHLTEEEYIQIQKHPESSLRILQPLTKYENDIDAVLHHHTHYDGSGYPGGLSGIDIPIGARIISVADTFDAMTTDRPYRKSLSINMARTELKRVSGKQLDPVVAETMIKIIDQGKVEKT